MDAIDALAADLESAETVVALTGAGLSAPSGVPTFRGEDGLWERFDQGQFHLERFHSDPAGFWADRRELQAAMDLESVEPNAGHDALAELAAAGTLEAIATQNVDGLHDPAAAAGAELLELHGNSARVRCRECERTRPSASVTGLALPPRCDCGGIFKPDVVLFGERLPVATLERARELARASDLFLAIGSSLVVEPAASLPRIAATSDATLAVVNLESTPCDDLATYCIREDVTDVLPSLAARV